MSDKHTNLWLMIIALLLAANLVQSGVRSSADQPDKLQKVMICDNSDNCVSLFNRDTGKYIEHNSTAWSLAVKN